MQSGGLEPLGRWVASEPLLTGCTQTPGSGEAGPQDPPTC